MVASTVGEIRLFAGITPPAGWAFFDGRAVAVGEYQALFEAIGYRWGGEGPVFRLPDLRGRVPVGAGQGPGLRERKLAETGGQETVTLNGTHLPAHDHDLVAQRSKATTASPGEAMLAQTTVASGTREALAYASGLSATGRRILRDDSVQATGGGGGHANRMPTLAINFIISLFGSTATAGMDAFIGEIRAFSFHAAPSGWLKCHGTRMVLHASRALYTVIGETFGGDGMTYFSLPDLRAAAALGPGAGEGLTRYALGEAAGAPTASLSVQQMPSHFHRAMFGISAVEANLSSSPSANTYASRIKLKGATPLALNFVRNLKPDVALAEPAIAPAGQGRPHENRQPFLVLNYCICRTGAFPFPP